MSLQYKIFLSFSALIILSLVLTGCLINIVYTRSAQDISLRNTRRELALIANTLNATIDHITDYAVSIAVDSRVISEARRYPTLPDTQAERYALRTSLGASIATIMGLNRNVLMWDMVSQENDYFSVGGYDLTPVANAVPDDFYEQVRTSLRVQAMGPYNISMWGMEIPVFLFAKPIVNLDTHAYYGMILFVVRESRFAAIFENNMPANEQASFYVVDGADRIVCCSNKAYLNQPFQNACPISARSLADLKASGSVVADADGVDTLFSLIDGVGGDGDWTVISRVPLDVALRAQARFNQILPYIALLACVLAMILSFFIAHTISLPVKRLAAAIRNAAEGDMQLIPEPKGGCEVRTLYVGFNSLMTTVSSLLDRIMAEQEEKSNYKFQLIQAQIKPHFLYNTLETIKSLIDLNMNDTASECTCAMSTFYRLSLNKGDDILTVRDEVELSRQYMYIQKLRYIDHLDYSFDVPESLGDFLLPKMTLQPILENAIYHGVKEKQAQGTICVTGRDAGDKIVFTVKDDGAGMDERQVEKLRSSIRHESGSPGEKLKSFGLASINRRIQLLYGDQYGIEIESRLDCYTIVTLTLPKSKLSGKEASR